VIRSGLDVASLEKSMQNRRQFLIGAVAAGAAPLLDLETWALPPKKSERAPLRAPEFYWGVGIENCWIAQVNPVKDGKRRLLDVYLQMQHYDRWKQDLLLAKSVGANCMRYSVPWYKAEPRPGVYDWSWIDKPIEFMVEKLGIIPIMDIIHYGTPAWMEDGVIDDRYPDALAAYSGAMASHFKGMVNHYSPQNEPGVTCLFCGLTGRWPPYQKNYEAFSKIGVRIAKAMILQMEAIRSAIPDAVITSVDPMFFGNIDAALPKGAAEDPAQVELRTAASAFPASLVYGKVDSKHPFFEFLVKHGVATGDLEWIHAHSNKPDIYGYNYYPDSFDFQKNGDFTRHGTVPLQQGASEAASRTEAGIRKAYEYFKMPIYLTETSAGLQTDAKVAYINALYASVKRLRADRIPIVGVNWWPLFNTIQWDYRENSTEPLASFIRSGDWNNGLYVIDTKTPDLRRVHTGAADAFAEVVRTDTMYWKKVRASRP
jgi:beta-glucosidase